MGVDKSFGRVRWVFWRILLVILAFTTALVASYYSIFLSDVASMGYLYYYYFDLLSSQSGIVLLAFFAGAASFFSPCAFALLPGYMSYYISIHENKVEKGRNRLFKVIYLGSLSALGILMLYTISGAMVAVFGASVEPYVVLMQPIVGAIIAGLGLVLLTDYSFNLSFLNRFIHRIERGAHEESKHAHLSRKLFLYGVGYGAAAAACTAPVFISLMIYSLVYGGLFMIVIAFLTYSITMGIMMVITTMLVGLAKEKLLDKMRTSAFLIKRASGFVLIIAGAYLVFGLLFRQVIA